MRFNRATVVHRWRHDAAEILICGCTFQSSHRRTPVATPKRNPIEPHASQFQSSHRRTPVATGGFPQRSDLLGSFNPATDVHRWRPPHVLGRQVVGGVVSIQPPTYTGGDFAIHVCGEPYDHPFQSSHRRTPVATRLLRDAVARPFTVSIQPPTYTGGDLRGPHGEVRRVWVSIQPPTYTGGDPSSSS